MRDNDFGDGVDSDSLMESVYGFLQDNLTYEEYEELDLWGEDAVDKAIEISQ